MFSLLYDAWRKELWKALLLDCPPLEMYVQQREGVRGVVKVMMVHNAALFRNVSIINCHGETQVRVLDRSHPVSDQGCFTCLITE